MKAITIEGVRQSLYGRKAVEVSDPTRREAAVALILTPGSAPGDLDILLIKRAEHPGDPWSGQMALPGGRRDKMDGELLATAVRETSEETGIDLTSADLLGQLNDLAPQTPVLPPVIVRPFVFAQTSRTEVALSNEVDFVVWASLAALVESSTEKEVRVHGLDLTVPAYMAEDQIVWGMTHRILNGLLDLTI